MNPSGMSILPVPPLSAMDIERAAHNYIRQKAPSLLREPGPFPVLEAWDDLQDDMPGLKAGVEILPERYEGRCDADSVFISEDTYLRLLRADGRARFTTVHEIGHAILHRPHLRSLRVMARLGANASLFRRLAVEVPAFRDPEWQANNFASRVLVPTPALRMLAEEHGGGVELTIAIQAVFRVSGEAAERAVDRLRKDDARRR
jgi:Zn-dependent peptidase ImmA (M78 family)